MKRIGLILLFAGLLLPVLTAAQRPVVVDSLGRHYELRLLPERMVFVPQHELRVQYGFFPIIGDRTWGLFEGHTDYDMPFYKGVRYGREWSSDAVAAAYTYRFTRLLEAGGVFSYAGFYQNRYNGAVADRSRSHYFTLMATLRLSWLNRPWVRMYSSLSLGAQWEHSRDFDDRKYNHCGVTGQLSLLGLSVGRRFFGFTEVGVGALGTFVFGVGYRFDAGTGK